MWLSVADKQWIKSNYASNLRLRESPTGQKLEGTLSFCMSYDKKTGIWSILSNGHYSQGVVLCDKYEIEIEFTKKYYLPRVKETGGRLKKVQRQKNLIDIRSLHVDKEGWACLCSKFEEQSKLPRGSSIDVFFYNLLIPFFYAQKYYQEYDIFPWGTYSHGLLGLIESYSHFRGWGSERKLRESIEKIREYVAEYNIYEEWEKCRYLLLKKKIKKHWPCLCGSREKFCLCHPKTLFGLRVLRKDIRTNKLKRIL